MGSGGGQCHYCRKAACVCPRDPVLVGRHCPHCGIDHALVAEVKRLRAVDAAATDLYNAANHYRGTGADFDGAALDKALEAMGTAWNQADLPGEGGGNV